MQALAPCCLFLAAKIEEQPRKLEHVIKVAHACLHRDGPPLDLKSEVCFISSIFHHYILKIQGSWQFCLCSCPGCCKTNLSKDFADCIYWTSVLSQRFLAVLNSLECFCTLIETQRKSFLILLENTVITTSTTCVCVFLSSRS